MAVRITQVLPRSPAARAGVLPGDELVAIGDEKIRDVLDYRFFTTESRLRLSLRRGGRPLFLSVTKGQYDDLGLAFESYLMDGQRSCKNRCVFCFIDQNPKGMRQSVYFKDDDARLSFLLGNYITLTNLTGQDVERIVRLRISPINVSVHTTDPQLRVRMMRNPDAGPSLALLDRLAQGGVRLNTQLVLCPGLNDGAALEKTLSDLGRLYPAVQSIACVPVGLTGHRGGLYPLRPFTRDEAGQTIDAIERFSDGWLKTRGERLAYPADEFFLRADRPIPPAEYYGEFAQLENGVGLIACCVDDFEAALPGLSPCGVPRRLTLATGRAAAPLIGGLCRRAEGVDPALSAQVRAIPARFFGGQITVAGLITGSDILAALAGADCGDALLIPSCMLRHEQDRFLDDMTVEQLSAALRVPVRVVPADGGSLAGALIERSDL
jgi:putative radical SAM enzyme (TIGR03279 family)